MLALLEAPEFNINEKFMQNLIAFAFKNYIIFCTHRLFTTFIVN